MIKKESLLEIGSFHKPHGIKGELTATFDYDIEPSELRCIILDIEGIYVPFFIDSFRRRSASSWLIKLDGVDSEIDAVVFSNQDIYAIAAELPEDITDEEDGFYLYDLEGYKLLADDEEIGVIDGVDDTTANILLIVKSDKGNIIYVPFAEEMITDINKDLKTISMELPAGLLDLNS